ncbi:sugar porter family MFS transporter [Hirschia baltica]|uniref:Sugar transporter n=1 Tax=Hirschia baltica (strain ATCC 49814 / DSM 5838 / IFAM 1418) TaxID=582402 RepID=C6XR10_HIRBI|nr:sugar porter family MFS transporter [Hirschia baltica]ACT60541.1 sugar transporter [Hirschia baltica ATCC 49814]
MSLEETTSAQPDTHGIGLAILITTVATLGGFLFGYDSGVINGTVKGLQVAFQSNSVGTGFSVASMLLGCAVGAAAAGRLADMFGRKPLLLMSAVFFVISAWGSGIAGTTNEFIIYRILGGLAVGAASVMAPAYISEIAPPHLRGRLTSIQQVAIIVGLTAAFVSNYFIVKVAGDSTAEFMMGFEAWRWMFWVELIPAAIFFFALFLIPESPRYLVSAGKKDEAHGVLTRLAGEQKAGVVVKEIEDTLAADHKPSLKDIFDPEGKGIRPIIWVGIGLAVFQQFVGINVIFYYGSVLWEFVGFTEEDGLLTNVIMGAVSIGAVLVSMALIDKMGRKPLLLIGSIGMAVSLAVMAGVFSMASVTETGLALPAGLGPVALIAAVIYVAFFNFSWGPVMWVMLGEMFPNQVRGSGLAVSGFFQWIANFGITMTFPILLATTGLFSAYALYAIAAGISVIFVFKFVKETMGKTLEEM